VGVFPGLLFADKGVVLLGLRLQDGKGESSLVQQEVIDKAVGGFLEVLPECIEGFFLEFYVCFKRDVGWAGFVVKKPIVRLRRRSLIRILALASFSISNLPIFYG